MSDLDKGLPLTEQDKANADLFANGGYFMLRDDTADGGWRRLNPEDVRVAGRVISLEVPETERTFFELSYTGHGRGEVVDQVSSGKFSYRPMTYSELAARVPAMKISDDIHRMATYAAFAYYKAWEIIAPAIEAALAGHPQTVGETYPPPRGGWTCFHCGETFAHEVTARAHFGETIDAQPGCQLKMQAGDRGLLRHIRQLEAKVRELEYQIRNDDTEKDRQIHGMISDHSTALVREEEKGYARGLADAQYQKVRIEIIEECARAALGAALPSHFHWGDEALRHFEFGKERCAQAIRQLRPPIEAEPTTEGAFNDEASHI